MSSSTESIRKIIDKSSIKFVCGIKLDTKNGKSEDRILVSRCLQPAHRGPASFNGPLFYSNSGAADVEETHYSCFISSLVHAWCLYGVSDVSVNGSLPQ